jgi:hypothetical protein
VTTTGLGVVEQMTLVNTSGLLSGGSKTSGFSVLVDRVTDPVVSGVSSDGLVGWVDQNDFEVLVGRILVNPVRVKDSHVRSTTTNSFFSSRS